MLYGSVTMSEVIDGRGKVRLHAKGEDPPDPPLVRALIVSTPPSSSILWDEGTSSFPSVSSRTSMRSLPLRGGRSSSVLVVQDLGLIPKQPFRKPGNVEWAFSACPALRISPSAA
jgi:hypothetical protein